MPIATGWMSSLGGRILLLLVIAEFSTDGLSVIALEDKNKGS